MIYYVPICLTFTSSPSYLFYVFGTFSDKIMIFPSKMLTDVA
jgi:hypothetical protein